MIKEEEQALLFEVFDREGNRVEWSTSPKCVFDKETFNLRVGAGQTIKLNGKSIEKYKELADLMKTAKT